MILASVWGETWRLATFIAGVFGLIWVWYALLSRMNVDNEPAGSVSESSPMVLTTVGPVEEFRALSPVNRTLAWIAVVCTVLITLIGALLFMWILLRYGLGESGR